MRIQLLRTFVVVASCRSFAVAAEQLLYSESSVTYHVRELEKSLRAQLIVRSGRSLELTRVGSAVLDVCIEVLAAADRLTDAVQVATMVDTRRPEPWVTDHGVAARRQPGGGARPGVPPARRPTPARLPPASAPVLAKASGYATPIPRALTSGPTK